jgi:hypothetical protein
MLSSFFRTALDEFLADGENRTLTLQLTNQSPMAVDDVATVEEFFSVAMTVLENDRDPDGEFGAGAVSIINQPQHGTVAIDATTGIVTYTPDDFFIGADAFTYVATDADGVVSNEATVRIAVTPAPRFPFEVISRAEPISDTPVGANSRRVC